jgi:4-carboxymuconolactone decarboxylase
MASPAASQFGTVLEAIWEKRSMADELYQKGDRIRREVLGNRHVDRSTANADPFAKVIQDYVTRIGWGEVWGREGLDRRSRSILNLGMLAALGKDLEMKTHIKGALKNGVTRDEIAEIFLQVALYCGAPTALECFRLAREAFEDVDANGLD